MRAIRRSFRFFPDFREHSNARFQVSLRNIFDQFGAQIVGSIENFFEDGFGTALEMDRLAAAILRRIAPLNPAIGFEAIEQTGQGRAFDSHPFRDLFLGEFISALGEVHQRPPFPLAQPERPQTLVEPGSPGSSSAEEDKAELADVGWRHFRELISVLTNPSLPQCQLLLPHPRENHGVTSIIGKGSNLVRS
jgi:hypothetical protein